MQFATDVLAIYSFGASYLFRISTFGFRIFPTAYSRRAFAFPGPSRTGLDADGDVGGVRGE